MPDKLKFELSLFEELLEADFHPQNIKETLKDKSVKDFKITIDAEALRVCKELRNATCRAIHEAVLERNIQMHEHEVIRMLDRVYSFIKPDADEEYAEIKACERCVEAYMVLEAGLKLVLRYIEKDLSKYFDLVNQQVPDSMRMEAAKEVGQLKNVMWAKMKSKEVDGQLQMVILNFINEHMAKERCSYSELSYMRLLVSTLLAALGGKDSKDWNKKIAQELICLNFNKNSFFTWCRRFIAAEIDGYTDSREQVGRFNWYVKEIKPLAAVPDACYRVGRAGIKKLLNNYIGVELAYLAEWHKENPTEAVSNLKERAEQFDFKLPLNLSAPQLSLMTQLFMDAGVFVVEKGQIVTVMRFLAAHVRTIGAEHLSAESLNKLRKRAEAKV